jgi:hypothetical protein
MQRRRARIPVAILRGFVRGVAALTLGAILLAVLTGVAVRMLVTPETLKARMVAQLQQTFHRPVSVRSVTLALHQGVKVSGLEVGEAEGFPGDRMLSSEFLLAKYSFAALLRGRLELEQVLLMAPRIRLARRKDGVWNAADAFLRPKDAPKPAGGWSLPPLQAARIIRIERGSLDVTDETRGTRASLQGLTVSIEGMNSETPFPVSLDLHGNGVVLGRSVRTSLQVRGDMSLGGLRRGEQRLDARRIVLDVDGHKVEASGVLRGFDDAFADLSLRLPRLDSAMLAKYAPVPPGIDIPESRWSLSLQGPSADAEDIRIRKFSVAAGPFVASVSGRVDPKSGWMRLGADLARFQLAQASAFYEGWSKKRLEGTAEGRITLVGPPARVAVDSFELTLAGFGVEWKENKRLSKADIRITGKDRLKTVELRSRNGSLVAYGNVLSDIDLDLRAASGDLLFRRLDVTWNESRFRLRGCVRGAAQMRKVVLDAEVDRLRLDETYAAIMNLIAQRKAEKGESTEPGRPWVRVFKSAIPQHFPDIAGRLRVAEVHSPNFRTANLELRCDLKDIAQGLEKVSGSFRVGFGPGRVSSVPDVRKAHPVPNVLLLPFSFMQELEAKARASFDTAALRTLDVNRTHGDFSVQRGVVDLRYVHFDSPQFMVYADGRVDFPKEDVALHVLMRATQPRGQLPFRLVDTEGRPALELNIVKDIKNPEVQLAQRKLESDAVEAALTDGLKRATPVADLESSLSCGGGK